MVPEGKVVKNRLHLDLCVGGGDGVPMELRKERIDAAAERLVGIGATMVGALEWPGMEHYAVALRDPEGNEFDLN
jgi:predicted enzyme related to lactoylglutathione lyase